MRVIFTILVIMLFGCSDCSDSYTQGREDMEAVLLEKLTNSCYQFEEAIFCIFPNEITQ
jgi:hypothetical protein